MEKSCSRTIVAMRTHVQLDKGSAPKFSTINANFRLPTNLSRAPPNILALSRHRGVVEIVPWIIAQKVRHTIAISLVCSGTFTLKN